MESQVLYFKDLNPENTQEVFQLVKERAKRLKIKKLVLASTTGDTARKALKYFQGEGLKLIVIPHQYGFREQNAFPPELVKTLREAGHEVHFSTMLFHTERLYRSEAPGLMADLLRCFSQGVKVCFEIVMMAADGGLVDNGEQVIALAGTGRGSDTALVMQAAPSNQLKKLRVNEILCKPLNPLNLDELKKTWGNDSH